jgi:hypothetical protein
VLHPVEKKVEPKHHLLIAGTGRSGTSALVRLMAACGMETILSNPGPNWFKGANAGAESLLLGRGKHPYVIKSPWTYQFIGQLLDTPSIAIDEVIIPIRKLSEAAASRIIIEAGQARKMVPDFNAYERPWSDFGQTPGGALYSLEPIDQERILGRSLHLLLEALEEREVPYRLLSFPRFVSDPDYAYGRLGHLFPDLDLEGFRRQFATVISKNQVRVEKEVAETRVTTRSVPAVAPLGIDALFLNALKRENAELASEVEALKSDLAAANAAAGQAPSFTSAPVCIDPDQAPLGHSYGDAAIGPEGLAGWHWLTHARADASFGFQLGFSDTTGAARYRYKDHGRWSPWMPMTPG